jgi:hypothetical protein
MKYIKLNTNWNAEPNAPKVEIKIQGDKLELEFFLNSFIFDHVNEGDKGQLLFTDCNKYSFNSCNDEGYFRGQYRYKNETLPWGEFYELMHDGEIDFHSDYKMVKDKTNEIGLKHFIFFFRDNTFECIARDFKFRYLNN